MKGGLNEWKNKMKHTPAWVGESNLGLPKTKTRLLDDKKRQNAKEPWWNERGKKNIRRLWLI